MEKTSKRTPRSLEGDFKREKKSPPVKSQEDYYNPKRAGRRRLIAAADQRPKDRPQRNEVHPHFFAVKPEVSG